MSGVDASVWREVGAPLVAGSGAGPLAGETVAVKDLFAIRGFRVGLGNPAFLDEAQPEAATAPGLGMLLAAGADVAGIAQTDEFAYSIAGANAHYGTPPNPAVPLGLSGGSSSGPAAAVALGEASIGLGTDTAGSIRVPASYQGLWGLRPTHGAVSLEGVWPLAPSFDTVGWMTRDRALLARVVDVALPGAEAEVAGFVVDPRLVALAVPAVREAFAAAVAPLSPAEVDLPDPTAMFEAFRLTQAAEAWVSDGAWISAHPGSTGPGVSDRFAAAAAVSAEQEVAARAAVAEHRARLDAALGDRVLLVPSTSSAAPARDADAATLDAVRGATLRLTAVAGLTGRPALSVPALRVPEPVGLCLVGPRGSEATLLELAARWDAAGSAPRG